MSEWRGCVGLNRDGFPCGAVPLRGTDKCRRHSMTDEEWRASSIRGGKRRAAKARERAEINESNRQARRVMPDATLQKALDTISDLLDATIPDTREPNMESRAWGVLLLATLFRLAPHQHAEALDLLRQVRPELAGDPELPRLLRLEETRQKLLDAYREGRIDIGELPAGVLEPILH